MRSLAAFEQLTLDGFFSGENGDFSWTHSRERQDQEWTSFAAENASGGGILLFGRVTFEIMAGYWPTPRAAQDNAIVAEHMNRMPKIVFSRTLDSVAWSNTRIVKSDPAAEVRRLKKEPGPNMAILGSGTIVSLLAREGLIDEYQLAVLPVVIGKGRTLFEGVHDRLPMKLTRTRSFKNGNVVSWYAPAAARAA